MKIIITRYLIDKMPFNYKLFRKERSSGFTLLELLVVIAIIGLFSSIVMVSLGSVRKDGRNTYRNQTIAEYAKALYLYYDTNGEYPIYTPTGGTLKCLAKTSCYFLGFTVPPNDTLNTALSPYIEIGEPFPTIDRGSNGKAQGPAYACIFANGECTGEAGSLYWFLEGGFLGVGNPNCSNNGRKTDLGNVIMCALDMGKAF